MSFVRVRPKLPFFKLSMHNTSGRSSGGQIIVRHKGGRRNWSLLKLDHFRATFDLPALVVSYVKLSSSQPLAALIKYPNGCLSYITIPHGIGPGVQLQTWLGFDHFIESRQPGNNLSLRYIQQGDHIISIYSLFGSRYSWARSAGTSCKVLYKTHDKEFFMLQLPSGQEHKVSLKSMAVLGRNSNPRHKLEITGKAGANRLAGIRPTVRGVAMNPVDHPHGGRTKTIQPEVSPWGWVAKRNF